MARYHFMRSDDMQNLGSMLVEIQVELGYRSEIDLFVTQAILQILVLRCVCLMITLITCELQIFVLPRQEPGHCERAV